MDDSLEKKLRELAKILNDCWQDVKPDSEMERRIEEASDIVKEILSDPGLELGHEHYFRPSLDDSKLICKCGAVKTKVVPGGA